MQKIPCRHGLLLLPDRKRLSMLRGSSLRTLLKWIFSCVALGPVLTISVWAGNGTTEAVGAVGAAGALGAAGTMIMGGAAGAGTQAAAAPESQNVVKTCSMNDINSYPELDKIRASNCITDRLFYQSAGWSPVRYCSGTRDGAKDEEDFLTSQMNTDLGKFKPVASASGAGAPQISASYLTAIQVSNVDIGATANMETSLKKAFDALSGIKSQHDAMVSQATTSLGLIKGDLATCDSGQALATDPVCGTVGAKLFVGQGAANCVTCLDLAIKLKQVEADHTNMSNLLQAALDGLRKRHDEVAACRAASQSQAVKVDGQVNNLQRSGVSDPSADPPIVGK